MTVGGLDAAAVDDGLIRPRHLRNLRREVLPAVRRPSAGCTELVADCWTAPAGMPERRLTQDVTRRPRQTPP